MPLFSWLLERMTCRPQTRRAPARTPTRVFRPRVEVLEGRDVPSTLTVTDNLDSGAGSLRAEIAAANPGDTIVFALPPSPNGQTITLSSGELLLNKSLTIDGPGAGQLAISGGHTSRVFEVTGSGTNVTLSGLTITDGNGLGHPGIFDGGAILNDNLATLTVIGCTVSNSVADYGGGIANEEATLHLVNSTLSGNVADGASGDGPTGEGGGLYCVESTVSMTDCILSGNTTNSSGAGVWLIGTGMTINGCTFTDNVLDGGGGAFGGRPFTTGEDIYSGDAAPPKGHHNNPPYPYLTVSNSVFTSNIGYLDGPIVGPWANGGGNTFA
jgi:hypothetical protein